MATEIPQSLQYEPPQSQVLTSFRFRAVLMLLSGAGAALNVYLAYSCFGTVRRAHLYSKLLLVNSRAFGREVPPDVIQGLQTPYFLWLAAAVFAGALAFDLLLAGRLLITLAFFNRNSERFIQRLRRYHHWKGMAVALLASTYFVFNLAAQFFVAAASRHSSLDTGPPLITTVLLLGFAMLPRWWIGRMLKKAGIES